MHVMSNKTISVSHRSTDEVIVWGEALTQSRVIGLFPKLRKAFIISRLKYWSLDAKSILEILEEEDLSNKTYSYQMMRITLASPTHSTAISH